MRFSEKIRKVVRTNTLGINSPSKLEEYIGAGKGSITTPLRNNTDPGEPTQKKIIEKLRINQHWWDTGEGEIFLRDNPNDTENHKDKGVKVLPLDAWELLEDDNREFKKEINNLWGMIRYLQGQSVKPHE